MKEFFLNIAMTASTLLASVFGAYAEPVQPSLQTAQIIEPPAQASSSPVEPKQNPATEVVSVKSFVPLTTVTQDSINKQFDAWMQVVISLIDKKSGNKSADQTGYIDNPAVAALGGGGGSGVVNNYYALAQRIDKLDGVTITNSSINGVSDFASLGGGEPFWSQSGSDIYYSIGNVGVGVTNPLAKLSIKSAPTLGSELISNGTFSGSAAGWTLPSGCADYSTDSITLFYDAECSGGVNDPEISTGINLIAGTTYLITFDVITNGDQPYIYFDTANDFFFNSGPFETGSHEVIFTSDYTGADTVYFDSWNYFDDTGWTIDNISIRPIISDKPAFALYDSNGATTTVLGLSSNNVAIGRGALSGVSTSYNINAIGYNAGYGATSAHNSNLFGFDAGYAATAANNSNFIGYYAGYAATAANNSNFIGYYAGNNATSSEYSNFFGANAGKDAAYASFSNFIGVAAGVGATNANTATFIGGDAGARATNAYKSIFIGGSAGVNAYNAAQSIFIGYGAGVSDTVDNRSSSFASTSIAIGQFSGTGGFSDSIAIGNGVMNSAPQQVNIGNVLYATGIYTTNTTQSATPTKAGKFGIGTSSPFAKFSVQANYGDRNRALFAVGSSTINATTTSFIITNTGTVGVATSTPWKTFSVVGSVAINGLTSSATGNYVCIDTATWEVTRGNGSSCTTSSMRFKQNITDLSYGLDSVLKMRPVSFIYKPEMNMGSSTHIGFIAEEMQQIIPEVVNVEADGQVGGIDYPSLTSVLAAAIKDVASITGVFKDNLVAWLGSAANGVTKLFAKEVKTEKLCVSDAGGETCLTRAQLTSLLQAQAATPAVAQTPEPEPEATSTPPVVEEEEPVPEPAPEAPVVTEE